MELISVVVESMHKTYLQLSDEICKTYTVIIKVNELQYGYYGVISYWISFEIISG